MKQDSSVDNIFKHGLTDNPYAGNAYRGWERLEKELDTPKEKRRFLVPILLLALLSITTFIAVNKFSNTENNVTTTASEKNEINSTVKHKEQPHGTINNVIEQQKPTNNDVAKTITVTTDKDNNKLLNSNIVVANGNTANIDNTNTPTAKTKKYSKGKLKATFTTPNLDDASFTSNSEQDDLVDNNKIVVTDIATIKTNSITNTIAIKNVTQLPKNLNSVVAKLSASKQKNSITDKKIFTEIIAGSDIFNLNKKMGYYAGVRVNKNIAKGTVISAGINYSFNAMNESYRLSSKPLGQTETDAQIRNMKMLRLPIYFQRQLAETKFALMAGLVPSYILDASVYNMPNSNNGNPANYRKFTMQDLNRFNILFGAGIKYAAFKNLSFELSGSYGFTGLVKNSYINQSNVNDNFKNIQAGIVYRLR